MTKTILDTFDRLNPASKNIPSEKIKIDMNRWGPNSTKIGSVLPRKKHDHPNSKKRPKLIFRIYPNFVVLTQKLQIPVNFYHYFMKTLPLQTILHRPLYDSLVPGDPSSLCAYKIIQQNRIKQIFWFFFFLLRVIPVLRILIKK